MALKKEIEFKNGVTISYHRLDNIIIDNKNKSINCDVISYCDESFRNQEIENKENQDKYEKLLELILVENEKEESERDVNQVIKWSNEANDLFNKFEEDIDLSVVKMNYKFNEVTDFSMDSLYNLLKQKEMFTGADDV